jgi:hypothetical protein
MQKAQGTIEYLVIIAIVVIIALVVVSIITGVTNPQNVTSTSSKTYWLSQTLAVLDGKADSAGTGQFTIKNQTDSTVTITGIKVGDINETYSEELFQNEKENFTISGIGACSGSNQSYNLVIYYTTKVGLNKTVFGQVPLVVSCSDIFGQILTFTLTNQDIDLNSIASLNITTIGSNYILLDLNLTGTWEIDSINDGNTDLNVSISDSTIILEEN